jgi:hypothetical protein
MSRPRLSSSNQIRPARRHVSLLLVLVTLAMSCAEKSDPEFDRQAFTKVFDQNQFSSAYYPVDFRQTPDGGYLILAERKVSQSSFRGTYLLKADEQGNFEREVALDGYSNPVGELMEVSGAFYFFAMDTLSLQAQLLKVDAAAQEVEVKTVGQATYPSAATREGDGFLLLSYNHMDKTSTISAHNVSGELVKGPKNFSIGAGEDVEEPIMNHILRTGKRFPFQVGKVSDGLYFFNGFENYSFSLVFTDMENDAPLGVVLGQQDDGGLSAITPLGNGKFAASRFDFGENYFLPGVALKTDGPTVGSYLGGHPLPELIPDAPVRILRTSADTRNILVYASDTKSKQIGLFFYDQATGEFLSSRYLGFSNPFEIAAIIETDDDGIAVCGTTWIAGRFPRICLFKISKEALGGQAD